MGTNGAPMVETNLETVRNPRIYSWKDVSKSVSMVKLLLNKNHKSYKSLGIASLLVRSALTFSAAISFMFYNERVGMQIRILVNHSWIYRLEFRL